ncbi:hypothetical protein [Siccirubricoccus sp. G192]|uniref:hypothetical protein n=1 Tax=Siccirubricoccus sp. G192 TaxID=2849651 RepID=UPI001C2C6CB1|nr:hypothetical protein [Siccirubricoccus sp. G192]MBV1799531.1 hypothetical protein [Siccirubricoccus sp. G192]
MLRMLLALLALVIMVPVGAAAQAASGSNVTPAPRRPSDLWFDPTQLPSFTGTVERYLSNPRGEVDALLFREGPQVVFPPDVAEAVRQVAPAGRPIIVWGIRARTAPVITMLAFAPNGDATPVVVDRFYWRLAGRQPVEQAVRLAVAGTVKQPYYSPQGEVAGAILEDGTVVLLPQGAAEGFRDLLKPGAKLAAEGLGQASETGRALLAERLGETAEALRPVPATPAGPAAAPPAAPGPQR